MNEHVEKGKKVLETLADLTQRQIRAVEHVLGCPECRGALIDAVAEGEVPREESELASGEPDMEGVLRQLESRTPGLLAAIQSRAQEARELYAELQRADPGRHMGLLRMRRFRSVPLANLLILESERAQPAALQRSKELARLALHLVHQMDRAPRLRAALVELRVRAYVLLGNAHRLGGRWRKAEEMFRRAESFGPALPARSSARAFYCQRLALLRLDTGRPDEAAGLLWRAADIYDACDELPEQGFCLAQIGFLLVEDSRPERAEPVLRRACVVLSHRVQPGLWVRARLALALCHAALGRPQRAVRLAEWTRPHFGKASALEQEAITWLDGKIAAWTGQHSRAGELLATVRADFLTSGRLRGTRMASDDLALLAASRRDPGGLGDLVSHLVPHLPCDPRQLAVLAALGRFAVAAETGEAVGGVRETAAWTLALLHRLRHHRLGKRPIFV